MTAVWVDADSFPRLVRDYLISYTKKLCIPIYFVANHPIPQKEDHPLFKMIICPQKQGAADDYIVSHVEGNDMAVTRDIPLAARLVEKNITVLNDRGTVYTVESIKKKLAEREFNLQLAQIGLINNKYSYFSEKELQAFSNAFDKEIHRLLKL